MKTTLKYYDIDGYYFRAAKKESALSAFWILKGKSCNKIKELQSTVHLDKSMFRDSAAIIALCGADYSGIVGMTKPAKPEEYKELANELKAIGYNLIIAKKSSYVDYGIFKSNLSHPAESNP